MCVHACMCVFVLLIPLLVSMTHDYHIMGLVAYIALELATRPASTLTQRESIELLTRLFQDTSFPPSHTHTHNCVLYNHQAYSDEGHVVVPCLYVTVVE